MEKPRFILPFVLFALFFSCSDKDNTTAPKEDFIFDGANQGCASFTVFRYNDNDNASISVSGNRENLGLSLDMQSFPVTNEDITVKILEFDGTVSSYHCDDVFGDDPEISKTWTATSGDVHIQILEDSITVQPWEVTWRIKVDLEQVILEDGSGETTTIEALNFEDVLVGWLPG